MDSLRHRPGDRTGNAYIDAMIALAEIGVTVAALRERAMQIGTGGLRLFARRVEGAFFSDLSAYAGIVNHARRVHAQADKRMAARALLAKTGNTIAAKINLAMAEADAKALPAAP